MSMMKILTRLNLNIVQLTKENNHLKEELAIAKAERDRYKGEVEELGARLDKYE